MLQVDKIPFECSTNAFAVYELVFVSKIPAGVVR